MAHWSERLTSTAKSRGISIAELARQTNTPYERVIKCAQGKVDQPRGNLMADMARILNVRLAWLQYGEEPAEISSTESSPHGSTTTGNEETTGPTEPPFFETAARIPNIQSWPKNLPVLGTAAGSETGAMQIDQNVIDYVRRPPGLDSASDAYGIYVIGDSMEPRFPSGELCLVHPHRPPRPGDDVVIQVQNQNNDGTEAFLKRLVRRGPGEVICSQFNPPKELVFATASVIAVHKVMPLHELLGY